MRTTLTLETAVAEKLKQEAEKSGQSFKAVVNAALKRGLDLEPPRQRKPFRVKPHASAYVVGVDSAQLNRLGDELAVDTWLNKGGAPEQSSK